MYMEEPEVYKEEQHVPPQGALPAHLSAILVPPGGAVDRVVYLPLDVSQAEERAGARSRARAIAGARAGANKSCSQWNKVTVALHFTS
jgi:hypothetical protein